MRWKRRYSHGNLCFFCFSACFIYIGSGGVIARKTYADFWLGILENRGVFYFILMGLLAILCIAGVITFFRNRSSNYWWRWIYLFGGSYVLFDLFAIAVGLDLWNELLLWMFDVNSPYWNIIWGFFVLLGGFVFVLGMKLLRQSREKN